MNGAINNRQQLDQHFFSPSEIAILLWWRRTPTRCSFDALVTDALAGSSHPHDPNLLFLDRGSPGSAMQWLREEKMAVFKPGWSMILQGWQCDEVLLNYRESWSVIHSSIKWSVCYALFHKRTLTIDYRGEDGCFPESAIKFRDNSRLRFAYPQWNQC